MKVNNDDEIAVDSRLVRFRKGGSLYFEGDEVRRSYQIVEGIVRTCRFHADGHRQVTGFHYPGDTVGLGQRNHFESAEAVTDLECRALAIQPDGKARSASAEDPSLADFLLQGALRNAHQSIFLFGRRTACERLAAFILMTARRLGCGLEVELPMGRTDIADYLGLTIHTVSRTFGMLCQDRLIALHGSQHCRILDLPGMRSLAGEVD